jgi:hypothetical protein
MTFAGEQAVGSALRIYRAGHHSRQKPSEVSHYARSSRLKKAKTWWIFHSSIHWPDNQRHRKADEKAGDARGDRRRLVYHVNAQ